MSTPLRIVGRVGLASLVLWFTQCSSNGPPEASPAQPGDTDAGLVDSASPSSEAGEPPPDAATPEPAKANVVFILADDLAWNLVEYMPRVVQMQKDGITFTRYFVTDSLCCPSRTSILTGKFPHGSGVFGNTGAQGGYTAFTANGNETNTFGTTLESSGYATAFMGKYLNGYDANVPAKIPGWTTWGLSAGGYAGFDYTLNEDGTPKKYGALPADYLTDVIAAQGASFVTKHAASENFVIELATFAPHAPYTPAPRHETLFPGLKLPRGGA